MEIKRPRFWIALGAMAINIYFAAAAHTVITQLAYVALATVTAAVYIIMADTGRDADLVGLIVKILDNSGIDLDEEVE